MARIKYYYDTETCKYERLKISTWDVVLNTTGFIFMAFIFAIGLSVLYSNYFPSAKEALLEKENEELTVYYALLNKEIDESAKILALLEEKDQKIYREIFEAQTSTTLKNPIADYNKYKRLLDNGFEKEDLIRQTLSKIEKLKTQLALQSHSCNQILKLAENKAQMLASIPAIQPLSNKELNKLVSGFGMRIHPIYKLKKMHTGCDFIAHRGTPVFATGDGVVTTVSKSFGGYGNEIEIDHGYGYITKYAHLESFSVKMGQKIKRGEQIGYSGNSGASTAPHLHYEVIHKGKKVDPVHYFYQDLNPSEYEKIRELAAQENQSLS